jgi:microcin C transport system substrate-binding protein
VALNRRDFIRGTALAVLMGSARIAAAPFAANPSHDEAAWEHGVSLLGNLKYPAGFTHFDWVNPAAPKGGSARRAAIGAYDSFIWWSPE